MRVRRTPSCRFLSLAAAVALFATGCGGSGEQARSTATDSGTVTVEGIQFPKPEVQKVKLAVGAADPTVLPIYLIDGLDEQFGLDVEIVQFSGTSQVTQAMLTGQVDAGNGSGGIAMATQGTSRPAKIAYVTSDVLTDEIITQPDVATAEDLKGRAIAISSFGSQSHASAKLGLQALGLTEDDVTITQVGNDAARLAALKGGSVAAAVLSPQVEKELTDSGFHVLQRLTDVHSGGYALTSLTVPEKFADENPNTMLALAALYTMGRHEMITDKEAAAKVWATQGDMPIEQARSDVDVELSIKQHPLDGRCDPAMINFVKEIAASTDAKLESVDAENACTNEYIDKLKAMGFQKALGVEGY
jgi:ABC-type nitrate/sulfonate/bicarbonate transport system substrate-binding protein